MQHAAHAVGQPKAVVPPSLKESMSGDAAVPPSHQNDSRNDERSARAVRVAEERYHALFTGSRDGLFLHDLEGRFIDANAAALRLLGYTAGASVSLTLADVLVPGDLDRAHAAIARLRSGHGHSPVQRYQLRRVDGNRVWAEVTTSLVYRDGEPYAVLGIARDITQRLAHEAEIGRLNLLLQREVAALEAVLEGVPTAIAIAEGGDATHVRPNVALTELLGLAPDTETIALDPGEATFRILRNGAPVAAADLPMSVAIREGRVVGETEYEVVRADGSRRTAISRAVPLRSDTGDIIGGVSAWVDVTRLKLTEADLRERVRELRCLQEVSRLLFSTEGDLDGAFEAVLAELPNGFVEPQEVHAQLVVDARAYGGDPAVDAVPVAEVSFRAGAARSLLRVFASAGRSSILPEEQLLVQAVAERIGAAAGLAEARQQLLRSEARFRSLIEKSTDIISLLDATGVVLYESPSVEVSLGWGAEELLGRRAFDLIHPDDLEPALEAVRQVLDNPDEVGGARFRFRRKGAGYEWVESRVQNRLGDPDVAALVVNSRIITERVEAEARIAFQAQLLDMVGEAVIATDLNGRILFWNSFATDMYGWSAGEVLGRSILEVTPTPASAEQAAEIMDHLRTGRCWSGEFMVRRRDGAEFPALVHNTPVTDAGGRLIGIVGTSSDISERRRFEEERRQAQKMEAIGRLAGGVAHDFNNILTAIIGHAELVHADLPPGHPCAGDVREIVKSAERAASLTGQLLAFSRRQVLQPHPLQLDAVVCELEPMLRRLIGEDITLDMRVEAEPCVNADPTQLQQVLLNLVINARDAMPDGGSLEVTVAQRRLDGDAASWELPPGNYALIRVRDDGSGMDAETASHVFEPFFTTRPSGTGLGLATVYGIVRQSGGGITVESQPGQGAAFTVLLPLAASGENLDTPVPTAVPAPARGETVLVVEDEFAVRGLVVRVLRRAGYNVLEAASPEYALREHGHRDDIDLLLTDVVMPGMSGPELAERLVGDSDRTRVLFMSGYMADEVERRGALAPGARLLHKPFTPDELAAAVRDILEPAGRTGLA